MTIPLSIATDDNITTLQAHGYRITGCCIGGRLFLIARRIDE